MNGSPPHEAISPAQAGPLRLHLLGSPAVVLGGNRHDVVPTRPALLLLYLGAVGRWVSREELATVLCSADGTPLGMGNLRLLLTRARKLPWSQNLESGPLRVRWPVQTDVQVFGDALRAGRWREASGLYPAPLLHGLAAEARGLPGLQNWLDNERAALHLRWLSAVEGAALEWLEQGAHAEAAGLLRRALTFEPLSEPLLQRFLEAAYLAGRRDEALRVYADFSARLAADLGLTPLPRTTELVAKLRRGEASLSPPRSGPQPGSAVPIPLEVQRPPLLVGREQELEHLLAATPVVMITGGPGLGKTRLLSDAFAEADAETPSKTPSRTPSRTWTLRGQPGLEQVPYFPVFGAIRARAGSLPDLGPYTADLAAVLPELFPGVTPRLETLTRARLLEALTLALGDAETLVADDLQWADAATLEWLGYVLGRGALGRGPEQRPWRLRGAYRPGEVSPALQGFLGSLPPESVTLTLGPWSADDTRRAVQTITGHGNQDRSQDRDQSDELSDWLQRQAGGQPLFTLEYLRALWEAGVYAAQDVAQDAIQPTGWQRLKALPERDFLPARLGDLIRHRVSQLPPAVRRVTELASVMGQVQDAAHLAEVLAIPPLEVSAALAHAHGAGLWGENTFAHDMQRQAVYRSLPELARRTLHAQIARTLEGRLDDLVVAEHAHLAGDAVRAGQLWMRAAQRVYGVAPGYEEEVTRLYERAALEGAGPVRDRAQVRLATRRRMAGRVDETRTLIAAVLQGSSDPEARTLAHGESAILAYMTGDMPLAQQHVRLALGAAAALDDPALWRDVRLAQVMIANRVGDYAAALEAGQKVLAEVRQEALSIDWCNWLSSVAASLCELGRFEEALPLYHEQLQVARQLQHAGQQICASSDIISVLADVGRIQEGVALAEEALSLGETYDTFPLRYHLALAYARSGRLQEALDFAEKVRTDSPSINMRAHAGALLAEVHTLRSDPEAVGGVLLACLNEVEACDLATARAVLVTAALRYGPATLLARAQAIADALDPATLPAYLRGDFELAQAPYSRTAHGEAAQPAGNL